VTKSTDNLCNDFRIFYPLKQNTKPPHVCQISNKFILIVLVWHIVTTLFVMQTHVLRACGYSIRMYGCAYVAAVSD